MALLAVVAILFGKLLRLGVAALLPLALLAVVTAFAVGIWLAAQRPLPRLPASDPLHHPGLVLRNTGRL